MSTSARIPPIPPPKPKNYQLPMNPHYMHYNKMGSDLPPPQDSDTDSGICADSDQSSPRHLPANTIGYPPPRHYAPPPPDRIDDSRDYLTPNSARRLFSEATISVSPRRLPQRPGAATAPPRATKQFRVRFADQVAESTASTSSGSSESNTSPKHPQNAAPCAYYGQQQQQPLPPPPQQNGYNGIPNPRTTFEPPTPTITDKRYDSLPRPQTSMRKLPHSSFSIEDVESLPEPPSYSVALQRLRNMQQWTRPQPVSTSRPPQPVSLSQSTSIGPSPNTMTNQMSSSMLGQALPLGPPRESIRDSVIRHSVENTLNRQYRNRSASLPRGSRRDYEIYDDQALSRPLYDYQMNRMPAEQLAGSLDNLQINTDIEYDIEGQSTRRRLPATPMGMPGNMMGQSDGMETMGRQPAYSRQRRCRRPMGGMMSRRSASVGRYEETAPMIATEYNFLGGVEAAVRAQLVALDHRGFRTVLVEKIQPGPFGFYIATGSMNGQRGIFISRVSIPSLSPVLSVGDEILYVDDELVKGRTLEYVQAMIAGKTSVMIVLLPSVGPAFC